MFRSSLQAAAQLALDHLEKLDAAPVGQTTDLATLRDRLRRPLTAEGLPPEEVLHDLARDAKGGILGSASGRFFAWVVGGCLPAALAADWLTAAWDQNAALYACAPAAAVVEEIVGDWLKDLLALPPAASFALVTGCQMAHVTCLAAARRALLERQGWNLDRDGLWGAPPIRILSGHERHGSIDRAFRLLGFGANNVVHISPGPDGRLEPGSLATALAEGPAAPAIVLLQAGDINTGAFDNFEAVIPIAKSHRAWVHVDGAFGLWAAASPRFRHLVSGLDQADSWATDGHKWLNTPFDCGYAFIADVEAHRNSMSHRASYLIHADSVRDQIDWNPDWSRRARGFPTYAAIRQLGREGIASLIDRCCDHARDIVRGIGALPGAEILSEPVINQGLIRFRDPNPSASDVDHDHWTDSVIAAIAATGEALFGGTTWRGRRAMRVSVCNWQTSENDVRRAVASVSRVLEEMTAAASTVR